MASAKSIVQALGGHWSGSHGMCKCPAHPDRAPSLSVSTDQSHERLLVHCFAGCPQEAVIQALRERGLWPELERRQDWHPTPEALAAWRARREKDAHERREETEARERDAQAIWLRAKPVQGTIAETYLARRGIRGKLPECLRFVSSMRHAPTGSIWPALLCAVQSGLGLVIGVQRIFLKPDGSGKAPIEPAKMTLGVLGDGAVRLGSPGRVLGLGEGPETCLSAMRIYRLPVWATLGAGRLGSVTLPDCVEEVVIFGDNGPVGEMAANKAADHYHQLGRTDHVVLPPSASKDFNDVLTGVAS